MYMFILTSDHCNILFQLEKVNWKFVFLNFSETLEAPLKICLGSLSLIFIEQTSSSLEKF
jgi:hypothetical protein